MALLNKRNAVLGWTAWQVAKRVGKRKVKQAVPRRGGESKRPKKGAVVSGLAALGGALWFWRRRRDDETSD
jgi:LPXTG-motif cell wall-anchored protein